MVSVEVVMTYSLPIRDTAYDKVSKLAAHKPWWANFTTTIRQEHFGLGFKFYQDDWLKHRAEVLATYNAKYDGTYVHFDSVQDATWFLLRWS